MYNYFYIKNNQNKLLNNSENKYYKIEDILEEIPIKVSGNSSCINVLNGFVRNYLNNKLIVQEPKTYQPYLIKDALLFSGIQQVYNHDIVTVGETKYSLAEEFLIVFNTENNSTILDFKYIKGTVEDASL